MEKIKKTIVYTAHAELRLKDKQIYKEWVEKTIEMPDRIIEVRDGRKKAIRKINGDKISVIYFDGPILTVIITAYWGE